MGTYTYLREEEIEVTDARGLSAWLDEVPPDSMFKKVSDDDKHEQDKRSCKEDYMFWKERLRQAFDGDYIDVSELIQESKLAGYWYRSEGLFLRDLAMFVEGHMTIIDENNDGLTRITFKKGDCIIEPGRLEEVFDKPRNLNKWVDMPKLDKKTQMMRKL